jgi:hypothetical protein
MRSVEPGEPKWKIEFDEEWVVHNGAMTVLRKLGYGAVVYRYTNSQAHESVISYVLYKHPHNEIIFETQDQYELNRYINLILPPRS